MPPLTKIEKLEDLIKGSIDGEIIEQTVGPLVPPGENFGSVIYKVDFKVKNGEKEETHHVVAKCTPLNQFTQEMFNIQVTIRAEIAWYTTVIPTIKKFQRDSGVEKEADFFQKFYGARISLDPNSDKVDIDSVILTQNLIPLGYKNVDRHIGFDLQTSKAILRDLAVFHAVPMAIKLKNKDLFDKNILAYLPDFQPPKDFNEGKDPFEGFREALQVIPEITPYLDQVVSSIKNNNPFSSTDKKPNEIWGSICHNDFWINNIMVKEGDDPKTVFLDFQVAKYDSIAIDLLFFLAVSVSLDAVDHMDDLIRYYWDEFFKNIKELNLDTSPYTYEGLLSEINKVAPALFVRTLFHIYIIYQEKGHSEFDSADENFNKEKFDDFKMTLNEKHKEKYKWLILEFNKRGWL